MFEKNGKLKSPLASCGYGAADIASLALRVAYWKLDGESRNVLALDEPLRNLDKERQVLASMMIKNLSRMKGGLQFVIVTHNTALAESADRVFGVIKEDEVSHVTIIGENRHE
jgi:DNA repair exonuclease SbcCD ATPase subunit